MPDFLLEIGCEEIPARMIDAASQELRERVGALLARERLSGGEITTLETPRRLAVMALGIAAAQADVVQPRELPRGDTSPERVTSDAGRRARKLLAASTAK